MTEQATTLGGDVSRVVVRMDRRALLTPFRRPMLRRTTFTSTFEPRRPVFDDGQRGLIAVEGGENHAVFDDLTWQRDADLLHQAFMLAELCSEDPVRQVACLIVSPGGQILAAGVNTRKVGGPEDGTRDLQFDHAETNALARLPAGDLPDGTTSYTTHIPCPPCGGDLVLRRGLDYVVFPNEVAVNYAQRMDKQADMQVVSDLFSASKIHERRMWAANLPLRSDIQAKCAAWFNKGVDVPVYRL